jgi:pimeloyl-ACP methyl ester carboxylesterase
MALANSPKTYIDPLHINGLSGRVMHVPGQSNAKAQRQILVVYGHHSSLERWWGLAQNFADFGDVTMPDLPGFGGMDSFYTIGMKPTLDNYADYLAAYVKMRYSRKKVAIVGISFGFLVVTRMLQKYPELNGKIEVLISAMGFTRYDEFTFSPSRYRFYIWASKIMTLRPLNSMVGLLCYNKPVLRALYTRSHNAKHKFKSINNAKQFEKTLDMEVALWRANDYRSHWSTTLQMLHVDHCDVAIQLPVWHVYTENDNYFNNSIVEQHMNIVFSNFVPLKIDVHAHAPSVIATKRQAASFMPKDLRELLKVRHNER